MARGHTPRGLILETSFLEDNFNVACDLKTSKQHRAALEQRTDFACDYERTTAKHRLTNTQQRWRRQRSTPTVYHLEIYPELRAMVGAEATAQAFACTSGAREDEEEALKVLFRAFVTANTDVVRAQVRATLLGFGSRCS